MFCGMHTVRLYANKSRAKILFSVDKSDYEIGKFQFPVDSSSLFDALPASRITKGLLSNQVISKAVIFDSIDSTNLELARRIKSGEGLQGEMILAEHQIAGMGRRGRRWYSPSRSGVYCSILWRFPKERMCDLGGLSLTVALSVIQSLDESGFTGLQVKWPNDVYLKNKKLAGILVEILDADMSDNAVSLIIGIGINTASSDLTHQDAPVQSISLEDVSGARVDRANIILSLSRSLERDMRQFEMGGFGYFHEKWDSFDIFRNKKVTVEFGGKTVTGIAKGVTASGELMLSTNDGIKTFNCGEVSMREGDDCCN